MKPPIWETCVLAGSFGLLWAWFIAYKGAERSNTALPLWWHFFLLVAIVLLVFVMVRRIKRLQKALRGEDENGESISSYPGFGGPPDFTRRPK
jgi:hypothetical protein